MIALLSPAKTMKFDRPERKGATASLFEDRAQELAGILKEKTQSDLRELMSISENLAELNYNRFQEMSFDPRPDHARAALDVFEGDVYKGIDSESLDKKGWKYAQNHLRILSGLYGILRPLDLIQPYRLEMGTSLEIDDDRTNLYEYWGKSLSDAINSELEKVSDPVIINLASNEYFKAVQKKELKAPVLEVQFKEWRDGKLKFITFYGKKARGLMARYMVDIQAQSIEDLKGFDYEGYGYEAEISDDWKWVFAREGTR